MMHFTYGTRRKTHLGLDYWPYHLAPSLSQTKILILHFWVVDRGSQLGLLDDLKSHYALPRSPGSCGKKISPYFLFTVVCENPQAGRPATGSSSHAADRNPLSLKKPSPAGRLQIHKSHPGTQQGNGALAAAVPWLLCLCWLQAFFKEVKESAYWNGAEIPSSLFVAVSSSFPLYLSFPNFR